MKLTYTQVGQCQLPDIALMPFEGEIGRYGRMRRDFLKEHRPILYDELILTEQLFPHLKEIDEAARNRIRTMLPRMQAQRGVTDALKAADQLRWVREMNAIREAIEEIIRDELITA